MTTLSIKVSGCDLLVGYHIRTVKIGGAHKGDVDTKVSVI